jgi:hypothetical protein
VIGSGYPKLSAALELYEKARAASRNAPHDSAFLSVAYRIDPNYCNGNGRIKAIFWKNAYSGPSHGH